jgi:glycosyltransferase involved in cell wall biosynthesis
MACGRPVISTNVGIAPEVIDESNGWIIPRRIDSLRGALEDCFDSMSSLQMMGVNAYKSVEERVSDWSAMYYEKMFDRVFDSYQQGGE